MIKNPSNPLCYKKFINQKYKRRRLNLATNVMKNRRKFYIQTLLYIYSRKGGRVLFFIKIPLIFSLPSLA